MDFPELQSKIVFAERIVALTIGAPLVYQKRKCALETGWSGDGSNLKLPVFKLR